MTTAETIKRLEWLRNYLTAEDCVAHANDIAALDKVINAAHGGKLYTAFDVIRIVQAAVSDAVCGMSREESTVTAYEIERDIVSRLVGGDSSERESRGLATGRRRNVELQITTASNNSFDVPQTAPD
jgi:hypothetical protein|nr:MAG TPA: hypothetical protein [Caudoviricetes sp.]